MKLKDYRVCPACGTRRFQHQNTAPHDVRDGMNWKRINLEQWQCTQCQHLEYVPEEESDE
jgi:rubredoxin